MEGYIARNDGDIYTGHPFHPYLAFQRKKIHTTNIREDSLFFFFFFLIE